MLVMGHMYHLGWGWGGGVVTMCLVLEDLRRRGHTAAFMLQRGDFTRETRTHGARRFGIDRVYASPLPRAKRRRYLEADVVITQGEATPEAMHMCRRYQKPLAHLIHDEGQLDGHQARPADVQLAIYNAEWVRAAAEAKGRGDNALVVYPFVRPEDYRDRPEAEAPHDCITLVNTCEQKGGKLFWELVRRMPRHRFLGVRGGWGGQLRPDELPANAEWMEHSFDPRDFYERARVVLMPSQDPAPPDQPWRWTESFGRIGIEAAASGIPTIAHPTPGLVESLGDAGTFIDREDPDAWVRALEALDDPDCYAEMAARARRRSAELAALNVAQMDALEAELVALAEGWRDAERPRPGDVAVSHIGGGGTVRLRALRRLSGRAKTGEIFEVTAHIGDSLVRRGLAEPVEASLPVSRPPRPTPPPEEAARNMMVYRSARGPGFTTREERDEHDQRRDAEARRAAAETAAASRENA